MFALRSHDGIHLIHRSKKHLHPNLRPGRKHFDTYFVENGKYSKDVRELNLIPGTSGIIVEVVGADGKCFPATGKHSQSKEIISIDCNWMK
jgi:hypothetical protein